MNFRSSSAIGLAVVLLVAVLAPLGAAQPTAPLPAIVLSASTITAREGFAAETYTVRLSTPPVAEVTVTITGMDAGLSVPSTTFTFGPSNYSTAQPVTVGVAGGDDAVLEGTKSYTLVHTASGSDPVYGGAGNAHAPVTASLTVYAADNDAGVAVFQTGGATAIGESGAAGINDTLVVSLGSAPSGPVTVRLAPSSTQFDVDRHSIVFTTANWHVPVSVNVFAIRDDVAEPSQAVSIAVTTPSGPAPYGGLSQSIPVTLSDDDVVALKLLDSAGTAALTGTPPAINTPAANSGEALSAGYKVVLGSQPSSPVTVSLSDASGQATLAPATLTFTAANWNLKQSVTVTAVQDQIDEGSNTVALVVPVVHSIQSADAAYDLLPDQSAAFRYLDDDTAGYYFAGSSTINATPSALSVTEATPPSPATYTLRLSSEPVSPVTVSFAGDAQITVTPASHVFNAANWDDVVTVSVLAVDDNVDEATFATGVAQSVASQDGRYQGIPATVAVNVADNDAAAFDLAVPAGFQVTEDGASAQFSVRLATKPTATVSVALTSSGGIQALPASLTFTVSDWNVFKTVTVDPIDDDDPELVEDATVTLDPSSADTFYNALASAVVPVTVLDDDGVVVVDETDGATVVQEGSGEDVYSVRLISSPAAQVNLTVTAPAGLLVNGAQTATLRFLPQVPEQGTGVLDAVNSILVGTLGLDPLDLDLVHQKAGGAWNQPQRIHVTAADDSAVTGSLPKTIVHTVESADGDYDGAIARGVLAYRLDDDVGILLVRAHDPLQLAEAGGTDTYTVRLSAPPAPGQSVAISLHPDPQVSVSDSTLYFDSYAWDFPQTVTVSAVQDDVDEASPHPGTIRHDVVTNDAAYASKTVPDVVAAIQDDDTAGATLTQTNGDTAVAEGGATDSYAIVLTSRPPGPVTIGLAASPSGRVSVSPGSITIEPATWSQPRTVLVTAIDDNVVDGPQTATIAHTLSGWAGITLPDVVAAIADNDAAGIPVTETGGSTTVNEGGLGDGLKLSLTSQPLSGVTVTLASADSRLRFDPPSLTFTSSNWATLQQSWVYAVEDGVIQGTGPATVTFTVTSGDATYDGFAVAPKTLTLVDNDAAGVAVTETGGSTTVNEGGLGDGLKLSLTSQPLSSVTVTLASTDSRLRFDPPSLTFTSSNWATLQQSWVYAVDDSVAQGTGPATVTFTVTSGDATYDGFAVAPKTLTLVDNDA